MGYETSLNTTKNQRHPYETAVWIFIIKVEHANIKVLALRRCKLFKIIMKIIYQPSLALTTMKAEKNKKDIKKILEMAKNKNQSKIL